MMEHSDLDVNDILGTYSSSVLLKWIKTYSSVSTAQSKSISTKVAHFAAKTFVNVLNF